MERLPKQANGSPPKSFQKYLLVRLNFVFFHLEALKTKTEQINKATTTTTTKPSGRPEASIGREHA